MKKSKIAKVLLALGIATTMAVPISANNVDFLFVLPPGAYDVTDYEEKDDNEQKAYVNSQSGNLGSSNPMKYSVWYNTSRRDTEYRTVTTTGKVTLNYTLHDGVPSYTYYLQGEAANIFVWVEGLWCP